MEKRAAKNDQYTCHMRTYTYCTLSISNPFQIGVVSMWLNDFTRLTIFSINGIFFIYFLFRKVLVGLNLHVLIFYWFQLKIKSKNQNKKNSNIDICLALIVWNWYRYCICDNVTRNIVLDASFHAMASRRPHTQYLNVT